MVQIKKIQYLTTILAVIVFLFISCDSEGEPTDESPPDYSGLLAEYADKVVVPALEELPAFTAEMGIPVRDSIEAEIILNALLTGNNSGNSVFYWLGYDYTIGSGSGRLENYSRGNLFFIEYVYDIEDYYVKRDTLISSKAKLDGDINYYYSDITIYSDSLMNYWNYCLRGDKWLTSDWESDAFEVTRAACGYTVSQGGFSAKIIVDYTYFSFGSYRGEGSVSIYGAGDQKLFVKKLSTRSHFRDFLYVLD